MKFGTRRSVGAALWLAGCILGRPHEAEAKWLSATSSHPSSLQVSGAGLSPVTSHHSENGAQPSVLNGSVSFEVPQRDSSDLGFQSDVANRFASLSLPGLAVSDLSSPHSELPLSQSGQWNSAAGLQGFVHGKSTSPKSSFFSHRDPAMQHCVSFQHGSGPPGGNHQPHHPHDPPPHSGPPPPHDPPPYHDPPPGGDPQPVPEPHSMALLGMGIVFACIGVFRRRSQRQDS